MKKYTEKNRYSTPMIIVSAFDLADVISSSQTENNTLSDQAFNGLDDEFV